MPKVRADRSFISIQNASNEAILECTLEYYKKVAKISLIFQKCFTYRNTVGMYQSKCETDQVVYVLSVIVLL